LSTLNGPNVANDTLMPKDASEAEIGATLAKGETISSGGRNWHSPADVAVPAMGDTLDQEHGLERGSDRTMLLVAAGFAMAIVAWAVVILTVQQVRFVVISPNAAEGVEAASDLARLFGALVLLLFPDNRAGQRLRWFTAGFIILGLGGLAFGDLRLLLQAAPDLNRAMYAALVTWTIAGALFAIGILPAKPIHFSRRVFALVTAVSILGVVIVTQSAHLPALVHITSVEDAARRGDVPLHGLTVWHWVLSSIPFGLAVITVVGLVRHSSRRVLGGWLTVSMVLLAGAQLYNLFWPWAFSPVLTSANVLRLAFAATVAVGGVLELRRIAAEREVLLVREHEYAHRLAELAVLKADFTAMVAHELGSPLAAIRGFAAMLATGELSREDQADAVAAIQAEIELITTLVHDMRTMAQVERDDFAVQLRPVPLGVLLGEAAAFATTLPGNHPVTTRLSGQERVRADPARLGQVLRNLLSNAAKYSADGKPIELRAHRTEEGRMRVEVVDQGYGIEPADLERIFEKFRRGRHPKGRKVAGVGLGLYATRRILQSHGSELMVQSTLGVGSVFAFELEVVH
jgi:signal transduction histidine kinase